MVKSYDDGLLAHNLLSLFTEDFLFSSMRKNQPITEMYIKILQGQGSLGEAAPTHFQKS